MVSATASPDAASEDTASSFSATRDYLSEFLVQATLIESYHSFLRHDKPYPFATPDSLRPGASAANYEHPFQRSALLLLIDGAVPNGLRKHIRFRRANEFSGDNLARLAPDIARDFPPPLGATMGDETFPDLLDRLLDVDYALLMQRAGGAPAPVTLSHMHVKVERLTDNAVRFLARDLGYIRRTLHENGEIYAEMLERKFFEYYGFAANASGRKCAAAMAAQLLGAAETRFAVFAACQEDCRLTLLDDSQTVTHHLLLPLAAEQLRAIGAKKTDDYAITDEAGGRVVCYRARFRHTAAARPHGVGSGMPRESGLARPWLEVAEQEILPLPGRTAPPLPFNWLARSKN
jgi:hypothetical protein